MTDSKQWFEQGKEHERKVLINLIKKEYGEDYYEMGVVGQIVRLIRSRDNASER